MLSEIRKILFDRIETVGDIGDVDALTMEHAAVQLNDLFQQLLRQHHVSGWLEFEKQKPNTDKLILVTNGSYVEICYYENEQPYKPWRFDEDDRCAFRIKDKSDPGWVQLWWREIDLPTIH